MGMSETLTNPPNILAPLPSAAAGEVFQELLRGGRFWLERIVSTGQATPPGEWYDQETDEWVLLVSGAARLRFEDEPHDRPLRPGDYLHIAAHRRHRVAWTDPEQATVWLAVHYTR
jgi:cupin 2 domain-containing protein